MPSSRGHAKHFFINAKFVYVPLAYCTYCLPVKAVQMEEDDLLDLSLGRSIHSMAQVEKFLKFQDSQGAWRAYLTETAELAYGGRGEDGSWGLGLGE